MTTKKLSESDREEAVTKLHRTVSIIQGALAMGVVVMLVFAVIRQPPGGDSTTSEYTPLCIIGLVMGVSCIMLRSAIPPLLIHQKIQTVARRSDDGDEASQSAHDLAGVSEAYQASAVISGALLEGAGMLNGIAYMIDGNLMNLGAAAALVITVLMGISSRNKISNWLDDRLREVQEIRIADGL